MPTTSIQESGNAGVRAVTLDFFDTLVFHRDGRGRGAALIEYLQTRGFDPAPWRHELLYEIFDPEAAAAYAPPYAAGRHTYFRFLGRRVFAGLGIPVRESDVRRHAAPLWQILGPRAFRVFGDVPDTLGALKAAGYSLAVISNWPCGLRHFCEELGLSGYFDFVLASGEIGAAKPDKAIFAEAVSRLTLDPERVLHVGDSVTDDYAGATASGLGVMVVDRHGSSGLPAEQNIDRLDRLPSLLDARNGRTS